ncbi:MAG: PLDc N-terminal domain-containing protein [Limisphaerales bacterium]
MLAVFGLGFYEFVVIFFFLGIGLIGTIFWIWALVDCGKRLGPGKQDKLGWLIAIALTHVIGAAAYLLFGRK